MKILFDATLEGLSTRMDNTIKVIIGTQEMNSQQAASLFELRGKFCKVLLSSTAIEPKEVEQVDSLPIKDESNNKSNSKRLRNVLHVYWEQAKKDFCTFDDFYNYEMNKIIDHYKAKLNG